jgi:hypothetical protein
MIKFFRLPVIWCMTSGTIIIKIAKLIVVNILMTILAGFLFKFYDNDSSIIPEVTGSAFQGFMPAAERKFRQIVVKGNIGPGTIPVTMLTSGRICHR